jgi:ABC-type Mn2+/Zn2+ transport system ATPase subunit
MGVHLWLQQRRSIAGIIAGPNGAIRTTLARQLLSAPNPTAVFRHAE